ncbi:unnamed protein product [Adineta steineri]|uniref:Uncharacterized protein n=1 Tax=Adineta steineri TaxID=433720 RepID=A0A815XIV4_9BILA|nr:unnamed protein product [Adineta steineri]
MMNILAYAGCIHQFQINANGHVQIDIYGYDSNTERFINAIEKPLIPSTITKSNKCIIVGSHIIDKGLLVLLHLITSNSSILMFLQLQPRPWLCHILYTLSIPLTIHGSIRFLSINGYMSIFINEDKTSNGFYIINNNEQKCQRNIEFIQCSLLTYIYCYLKDNYYWLMGSEIDSDTGEQLIKVYYGCSTSLSTPLVSFNTNKFIPISLTDNIQDLYIINHKLQLKTRIILGDLILLSKDHRILTCHNGTITHELSMNSSMNSILYYHTIENEQLFLVKKQDNNSIELFQYDDENFTLTSFLNTHETADYILMDDFTQIGWKQILFLKNNLDFNTFMLTDFSQIHIFQQESDCEYNTEMKHLSMETDDIDIHNSLILAQDILRKKIINADFIVNEGYFHCKQIEDDIRKISNKYYVPDLNKHTQSDILLQNSTNTTSILQLIDKNWFIYRTNLFIYVTIKNISNNTLSSVHLFGIDKHTNKMKLFDLKSSFQLLLNEQILFNLNPNSSRTLILTTSIELDRDNDIELYLLINDNNKLFHINSIHISIEDLFNSNNERILKMNALEVESTSHFMYRQAFIYMNTLFRLDVNIQSPSKFHLIEHFRQLLINLGFKHIISLPNVYIRVNQGNIFEHVLIHLVNEDDVIEEDLIVHFYAENSIECKMFIKYILSKLDFQSFSLINPINSSDQQQNHLILNRIQLELTSYMDILKQIPTIMRKVAPTSKSESYRLLKFENFQLFQNQRHLTDLLLASLIID